MCVCLIADVFSPEFDSLSLSLLNQLLRSTSVFVLPPTLPGITFSEHEPEKNRLS